MAKQMGERIRAEVKRLDMEGSVKQLGYVSSRDLDALYQEAVGVTMVSRFEGFGAPCLEAMSRGCPVIGANATAIPEVIDDAGLLCSPDNPEEWFEAMNTLIEDEERRAQLKKAGQERATEFTWSRAADILEDSYRFVLETTL
jgi:alpha-1,3-rhamnosyl/mannosyltransferase